MEAEEVTDHVEVTATTPRVYTRVGRFLREILVGWLLPLAVVLAVVEFFVYRETSVPGLAPRPASGMQDLSSEADLQARFTQDIGHPRLLLLISPT